MRKPSSKLNIYLKMGISLFVIIFLLGFVIPFFLPYRYDEIALEKANRSPSWVNLFGTDDLGRDIFTRVCYGIRISLCVAFLAGFFDLTFGFFWGATAAFKGGVIDAMMNRFMDVLYSIPYLLVTIMLVVVFGSGLFALALALSFIGWIPMARVVRGHIIQVKQTDYYIAAVVIGNGFFRLLFKHVLPNIISPIVITLTLTIPSAIFAEAFLSYLGLGLQPPLASLGTMAHDGLASLAFYPWRIFFPGLFIVLIILGFNLVGEGLKANVENSYD